MPNAKAITVGAVIAALTIPAAAIADAINTTDASANDRVITKVEARVAAADAIASARLLESGPRAEVAAIKAAQTAGPAAREQVRDAADAALAAKYTPAYAKSYARSYMSKHYGWGAGEYRALQELWTRESNWDYQATNPTSGAYGIPQSLPAGKMASEGDDWRTNPEPQIRWGLRYIQQTYGTPSATVSFWHANGWY